MAPEFTALDLEGEAVTSVSLRGKPTVLVFWASWCGPCRKEIPHLNELRQSYGDRINILGINMGEPVPTAHRAAASLGMRYPSLVDPRSELATRYAVHSIPLVLILDETGRIRLRGNGLPRRPSVLIDGLLTDG